MINYAELPTVRVIPVDITTVDLSTILSDPLYLLIHNKLYRIVELPKTNSL